MATSFKDVRFSVLPDELAQLKARAHAVGMPLSAWVRQMLGMPKLPETRGRKRTGRKPASERKRNDTIERGVGKGNYTRKPRVPRMVQASLFHEEAPPASAPSSAPAKGPASSARAAVA